MHWQWGRDSRSRGCQTWIHWGWRQFFAVNKNGDVVQAFNNFICLGRKKLQ